MITDDDIYEFLEHAGVKGMKWGVRRTRKFQKRRIDPKRRVAEGGGNKRDKLRTALDYTLGDVVKGRNLQEKASADLDRAAALQSRIKKGEAKTAKILTMSAGLRMADMNYSYKKK